MFPSIIEFKYDNLKSEFDKIDEKLQIIIYALAGFVYHNFNKSLLITELLRTKQMQDEYYKDNAEYKKKPWESVHQWARGCDVSLKYFTHEEINLIYRFINSHFVYSNKLNVALIHNIGWGEHLHLQVPSSENMVLKKY